MLIMEDRGSGCSVWMTEEVDAQNRRQRKWMILMEDKGSGCWELMTEEVDAW